MISFHLLFALPFCIVHLLILAPFLHFTLSHTQPLFIAILNSSFSFMCKLSDWQSQSQIVFIIYDVSLEKVLGHIIYFASTHIPKILTYTSQTCHHSSAHLHIKILFVQINFLSHSKRIQCSKTSEYEMLMFNSTAKIAGGCTYIFSTQTTWTHLTGNLLFL